MFGDYFVLVLLGLLVVGLVGWVIAGVVAKRRQARAVARVAAQFQQPSDGQAG